MCPPGSFDREPRKRRAGREALCELILAGDDGFFNLSRGSGPYGEKEHSRSETMD
jgi:hypothetical protein